MEEKWYKLDNAAKIYPAIREQNWSPVFRIDAVLKDEVNPQILQSALLMTYKRFPTFSVHIAEGVFWYYFEPNESEPEVRLENTYPAGPFSEEKDKGYLFRVLYYKKRISLEVFHAISDGFGAGIFLKTLLFNYFTLLNGAEPVSDLLELGRYGMLYHRDIPTTYEVEDSFQYIATGRESMKFKECAAFKIPGSRIKKDMLKVLHILVNVDSLRSLSERFDSTITEFITALFIYAILNSRVYNPTQKKPIKISVPINLRKRFPSVTMRNFSSYINVEFYPKKEASQVDLNEICREVRRQIHEGTDPDILRSRINGNVQIEKNIVMRMAPLFIKRIALRIGYSLYGERITTSTVSNMGRMELPPEIAPMVERFDFLLGAPKKNAFNCAIISYRDKISITFTSIISENIIPKNIVDFLVDNGVEAEVESNY